MTRRFRRAALTDVQQAFNWSEEQRPGLGDSFRSALNEALDRIEANPHLYPRVVGSIRRAGLPRPFAHLVFYRFLDGGDLEILAVFHPARNPEIWQRR